MKEVYPKGSGGPLDGCGTRLLILVLLILAIIKISCGALFSTQNTELHKKAVQGELLPDSTEAKQ